MHVAQAILERLSNHTGQVAISLPSGKTIKNGDLRDQTIRFSQVLVERGIQPGDHVLIQVPNGVDLAITCLSTMLTGGVPILASLSIGLSIYREEIRLTNPKWLIVDRKLSLIKRFSILKYVVELTGVQIPPEPEIPAARKIIFKKSGKHGLGGGTQVLALDSRCIDPGIDAGIAFTGGTTSKPKCVRYSHEVMESILLNIKKLVEPQGSLGYLADNPLQAFYALYVGKTVYLSTQKNKASYLYRKIMDGSVDTYFSSPYLWKEVIDICKSRRTTLPSSLHMILLGAAPVSKEFLAELLRWVHESTSITCLYGLTETGPVCTISASEKLAWSGEGDLVGSPINGFEIKINRGENSDNEIGEVVIHGKTMFRGYLNEAPRKSSEGFATGDLGRLVRLEGKEMLVLSGRKKDMIIRKGVNIYPAILEDQLSRYQIQNNLHCFDECAVIGFWQPETQDEKTVLCFVPEDKNISATQMMDLSARALGTKSLINHCLAFPRFPVTGRQNKLDRKQLARLAKQKLVGVE